jgi:hypothetical protein
LRVRLFRTLPPFLATHDAASRAALEKAFWADPAVQ